MRQYASKGLAKTLIFYPPEGVPKADGTINVYQQGTSLLSGFSADETATRSTVSLTPNASSASGTRTMTFASTTGVVRGDKVWITSPAGEVEEGIVDGLTSTTVKLLDPLRYDHTTSSSLKIGRLTYALTTTHTANINRDLRIVWKYTVTMPLGDQVFVKQQWLDVVHYDWVEDVNVTESDVEEIYPPYGQKMGARSQRHQQIKAGVTEDVYQWLKSNSVFPDQVKDTDLIKSLIVRGIIVRFLKTFSPGDDGAIERAEKEFEQRMSLTLASPMWVDIDDDQVQDGRISYAVQVGDDILTYYTDDPETGTRLDEMLGIPGGRRFKIG